MAHPQGFAALRLEAATRRYPSDSVTIPLDSPTRRSVTSRRSFVI